MKNFKKFDKFPVFKNLFKEIKQTKIESKSEGMNYLKQKNIGTQNPGYYLHSLFLSFYFLKNFSIYDNYWNTYEEIILTVCDLGGDTDTNAAILGGVLGAGFGFNQLSNKVDEMLKCSIIADRWRSDEKRGLYSPGLILFVIQELYKFR